MLNFETALDVVLTAVRPVPMDPGFPEWLVFFFTLACIVLAYGIQEVRARYKKKATEFMQRQESAALPPANQDHGQSV